MDFRIEMTRFDLEVRFDAKKGGKGVRPNEKLMKNWSDTGCNNNYSCLLTSLLRNRSKSY